MAVTEDDLVWPLLVDLASELSNEITVSGLQEPCWEGVLPGALAALEYCQPCGTKCGMAWTRLSSVNEYVDQNSIAGGSPCGALFTATFEMAIVRCHQTMDARGNPMPMSYQMEIARVQMAEMAAMKRVLLCSSTTQGMNVALGSYQPIGPDGGCVGGAWTAEVEMF